jgi:NADH:ubiquinone oxidoreductase subunit K
MLLATSTLYVLISKIILNFLGFFYLLVILIIAAAEAVIGLTLIIVAYRTKQEILLSSYNFLIN